MKYLTQKLKIGYKCSDGHFISSEVEVEYDDDDNVTEVLEKARQHLVDTISNGRPAIHVECLSIMGIEYSMATRKNLEENYQRISDEIYNLRQKNLIAESKYSRLLSEITRLKQIENVLEFAGVFDELTTILYSLVTNDEDKNIFEPETGLPHLQLNKVYPLEEDLSIEDD